MSAEDTVPRRIVFAKRTWDQVVEIAEERGVDPTVLVSELISRGIPLLDACSKRVPRHKKKLVRSKRPSTKR